MGWGWGKPTRPARVARRIWGHLTYQGGGDGGCKPCSGPVRLPSLRADRYEGMCCKSALGAWCPETQQ
ncbi:hypothetical protein NL676_018890 [Syzygium grande]|nr:hypothetical protein NL676_018890 [Syzygium grande]